MQGEIEEAAFRSQTRGRVGRAGDRRRQPLRRGRAGEHVELHRIDPRGRAPPARAHRACPRRAERRRGARPRSPRCARLPPATDEPAAPAARGPACPLHGGRDLRRLAGALGHLRQARDADAPRVRILLVSQMYPGPGTPDLGSFVAELERELGAARPRARSAPSSTAAAAAAVTLRSRGTSCARRARSGRTSSTPTSSCRPGCSRPGGSRARSSSPHTARTSRTRARAGSFAQPTRLTVRRAHAVIAVSSWLRARLEQVVPEAAGKTEVIDCGVDLDPLRAARRRRRLERRSAGRQRARHSSASARSASARTCCGSRGAFEQRGEGELVFVGDGPLRPALEGRPGIRLVGPRAARPRAGVDGGARRRLPAEPRRALRPRHARGHGVRPHRRRDAVGGPPEFVPDAARRPRRPVRRGRARRARSRRRRGFPRPNAAARAAAEDHDIRRQAERVEALLARACRDRRA